MELKKKLILVALVLAGFVIYVDVGQKAEPTWKVNKSQFTVVKSVEKGLEGELSNSPQLKMLNYFGQLKPTDKKIMVPGEQRSINIERTWSSYYTTYILYSVDLKKNDQSPLDVPYIDVNSVEYSSNNGQRIKVAAVDKGISNFVYRHRLYRSIHVVPKLANRNEWDKLQGMNKITFINTKVITDQQSDVIEPITVKIDESALEKSYAKKSVDKKFTLPTNSKVTIKDYELNVYGSRFTLDMDYEKNLVGFYGSNHYHFEQWGLLGSEKKGYSLYFDSGEDPLSKKQLNFKLLGAIYRSDQTIEWIISKHEITKLFQRKASPKKKVIKGDANGTRISYLGLGFKENQPYIGFSLEPKEMKEILVWPQTEEDLLNRVEQEVKDRMNNLVLLKTRNGEKVDISIDFSEEGLPNEFAMMLPKDFKPQEVKVQIVHPAYYKKFENDINIQVKTSKLKRRIKE